jgi:2-methylisocitrate lyase-like PEP mutase family enzyme
MSSEINTRAQSFKSLHIPGQPLILVNVHDAFSARIVASLPECKALATASFSIALANNTVDADLDLKTQIKAVQEIAAVAHQANKPLSVDFQAGYGEELEEGVQKLIALGVVGINLEDADPKTEVVFEEAVAVSRIKRALAVAAKAGVPDFVVNARSDTLLRGGTLEEAIRRGRLYLDAGATSIYILGGGSPNDARNNVKKMVEGLDGKVNVALRLPKEGGPATLSSKDIADLGAARISIGPQLYAPTVEAIKNTAGKVFGT